MSSATFTSGPGPGPRPSAHHHHTNNRHPTAAGATAIGTTHPSHRLGEAVRAVKVFAGAAFRVAVLGEYAQEAGVKRR